MMRYRITQACEKIGVEEEFIVRCIQAHWIEPEGAEGPEGNKPGAPKTRELDEEDLARARLIRELMEDFGANAEAIPVILHLLDQLYELRRQARVWAGSRSDLEGETRGTRRTG